MKKIKGLCSLLFLVYTLSLCSQSPNVIVVIADDMGWSQVSTGLTNFNNPSDFYETPNLDAMAVQGIAFPFGYVNGANCAPTRSAILSGQYASRPNNNIWAVDNLNRGGSNTLLVGPSQGLPNGVDELPTSAITIAETMKTAGYATVHLGKFHVGEDENSNTTNNAATDQGFDFNYGGGTKGNPGNYFASSSAPYTFHGNIGPELDAYAAPYTAAESLALAGDNSIEGTKKHVTDAMADAAIDWMELNKSTPFFMHFSNYAIHGPFDTGNARPDLLAKYQAKAPSQMGHNNIGQAAIAEGMDQTIGRLVDYLKTTDDPRNPGNKLSQNTLVYFISDNGGAISSDDAGPLRAMKGELYEGGIRSVTIAWSEAPWLANKGTVNTTPVMAFDLYPTIAEMGGASLPNNYPIDGVSQWQMLTNGTALGRDALYWHFPGYLVDSKRNQRPVSIIRKGDYKLIHNYETASYELYNLVTDISETTNLLSGNPDQATLTIANDMSTDLQNHLVNIAAPLPTYRSNGQTVPLPYIISTGGGTPNSTEGCQAVSGYTAYWDFDAASNANDASGNANDANPVNGTLSYDTVDVIEGDQSVIFDGTVDINYSSDTFLSQVTTARSLSAWIKPTALSGIQELFDEGGNTVGIALRLNGSTLEAVVRESLTSSTIVSAAYPTDGAWHHVALVYDGASTSQTLYIDGVNAATTNTAPASIGTHNATGGGIGGVIGSWDSFPNDTDSYFTGKMDAFAVYDVALTATQINDAACVGVTNPSSGCQPVATYDAYWDFDSVNSANDASGNNRNPTATLATSITFDAADVVEGDQSVVFAGTDAIQYATNSTSPNSFLNTAMSARTVMAWVKPTALSGIQNIFDEGGQNRGIAIRLNGTTLETIVRENNVAIADQLSTAFPNDGNWHHITLVYDGAITRHTLYLDGIEVATSSSAPSNIADHFSFGGIGGKLSGNDSFINSADAFFTGKMDAFAVYNTALSLQDVQSSACIAQQVVANAGPDVDLCEGDSTVLTATGGTSYVWNTGETTASITVSPNVTTTYTVTVSDGTGTATDSVTVTVNALPIANAGADVTIDQGNATTLTATGGGTYLWSTGATTASITVSPTSTTIYTVTVSQNGCSTVDDVQVTVNATGGCTYSVLNTEGFENGWGIWNDGGSDAARDGTAAYATTGSYSMRLRDDTNTSVGTTDNLDLTAYSEITVDFGYYCRSMDNATEDFWLQLSTDGGATFTTVEEWNLGDEFQNDVFYTDLVIIPGPFTANTQLRFRADASGNQDWVYIDDVVISGCSTSGGAKVLSTKTLSSSETLEASQHVSQFVKSTLYPNPFTDKIIVSVDGAYKEIEIQIFNLIGQTVFHKVFKDNTPIEIPTQQLRTGQYNIRIHVDGKMVLKRAIKQ